MKIALIRKEYARQRGGAERYAVNLARGLAGAGHEVHVFAGSWEQEDRAGIIMHRVPFMTKPSALKNLSFQRNSRRRVARESFDIVQGLSQVYPSDVYRMAEPLHAHCLQLFYAHPAKKLFARLSPRHRAILSIERAIFTPGNYRRVVAISQLCRQHLMHYYGVPDDKIRLIYNGVDTQQFNTAESGRRRLAARARLNIPGSDTVLLFAGHDFKRKGLRFALQYAIALQQKGHAVRLLVAGRGNHAPFLRMARQENFSDRLLFCGPVPAMCDLYHTADLLVHPALYEPFGNVCLEAMACGLPVATTRHTGASDIIDDGLCGIVTDTPWNSEAMVEGISRLLENDRAGLRTAGRQAAQWAAEFPLERHVREMLTLYREVRAEKDAAR